MPSAPAFYRTLSMGRRGPMTRQEFRQRLVRVLGATPVLGFLPKLSDTNTTVCPWSGKTLTADGTMTLTALGRGATRTFNGTSNNLTTPDAADLSFGNGTTDSPFSVFALVNITDTAAQRTMIVKWNATGTAREWNFAVNGADTLVLTLYDESVDVAPFRGSDAAITMGSHQLFSATYSAATGGATAADDITLYRGGVVFASTASNQATYVAMEDTASPCYIGAQNATPNNFMAGSGAFMLVAPVNASAAQHANVATLCRQFFGVPL